MTPDRRRAVRMVVVWSVLVAATTWGVWTALTHWSGENRALGAGVALVALAAALFMLSRGLGRGSAPAPTGGEEQTP